MALVNNDSLQSWYKTSKIESLRLSVSLARETVKYEQDTKMWMMVNVCANDWSWSLFLSASFDRAEMARRTSNSSDAYRSTCKLQIDSICPFISLHFCQLSVAISKLCCDGNSQAFQAQIEVHEGTAPESQRLVFRGATMQDRINSIITVLT